MSVLECGYLARLLPDNIAYYHIILCELYRPFHVGVVSRLATAVYVAMVTPILYDNYSSLNGSNLKYKSYRRYG